MILVSTRLYTRLRQHFYDGPAVFTYPGRKIIGYRSPTLLIYLWVKAFAVTYFTVPGRILFLVAATIITAGLLSNLMPIFILSFALLSLFLTDVAAGWYWRPRLHVERRAPAVGAPCTPLHIDYIVKNLSNKPCWDVFVDTILLPPQLQFSHDLRCISLLEPMQAVSLSNSIEADRRGKYYLPLPVADSAFPFGLWRWGSRGKPSEPLLIYPSYAPLTEVALPSGHQYQSGGEFATDTAGESVHFLACREYRYGDNPRRIHARSWARVGAPVVKEFSEEFLQRIGLVVDTTVAASPGWLKAVETELLQRQNNLFEATLSLTAALADFLCGVGYNVNFVAPAHSPVAVCGSGGNQLHAILEILACMDESTGSGVATLSEQALLELQAGSAVILVLQKWDRSRAAIVEQLRARDIFTDVVIVYDTPQPTDEAVAAGICLPADDILAGRVCQVP
jgi:uncharacterized protein (DUF58 family)